MPRVLVRTAFQDIKFECQMCGSCCHHRRPEEFGDLVPSERIEEFVEKSNLIYLTDKDISKIGRKTGCGPAGFVDTLYEYDGNCVKLVDSGRKIILDLPVMKSKADTTCVFYQDGCTVYQVRPNACRLFPFRVEEKTGPGGDVVLEISYNPSCPGVGKGKSVDKSKLEKLVRDQFVQRTESIWPEVQRLASNGEISREARIYRSHPGRSNQDDKSKK
ncbi:MAG TPA: YkgJ family cysteine cluster protein [Methanotrichaceae archaeon]|nr:YkgJ family cysteine cluster protein [Methanotrichaceae archaeon]